DTPRTMGSLAAPQIYHAVAWHEHLVDLSSGRCRRCDGCRRDDDRDLAPVSRCSDDWRVCPRDPRAAQSAGTSKSIRPRTALAPDTVLSIFTRSTRFGPPG